MSEDLRELAAGVLCVGFDGTRIDGELERTFRESQFGGVILFARNVTSLARTRELTDRVRSFYKVTPPLVTIDQEGGRVARLREGVEELPPMMSLGATGDPELARRAGAQCAFDLRRAGVTVDFAPVVDLALHRDNTVIGSRAFGSDPVRVTQLASAFAAGLADGGITPTYKHFPGHGATAVDSHLDLPVIDADEATLRERDLLPFELLVPSAPAVMTAHVVVRAFDRENPATLSPRVLTTLLRDELRFAGVCFTDCMQMEAMTRAGRVAGNAVVALRAGADCVLFSHDIGVALESIDRIVSAVRDGGLAYERLHQAYERVMQLRRAGATPLRLDAAPPYPGIGREIGRRAVTLVRGEPHADPATSIVVTFQGTTIEGVQGLHSTHPSLGALAEVEEIRLPLDPRPDQASELLEQIAESTKRPVVLLRRAHVYPGQAAALARLLESRPESIVVSLREPFDALACTQAATVLCAYGDDAPSIGGLADVLFGGAPALGRLPLENAAVF